jgi:hypothetical protein
MEVTPFQDACCPPLPAAIGSIRQALRNFRISVSASTHLIGAPQNNFSHYFQEHPNAHLSSFRTSCPASLHPCITSLHSLSQFASSAASFRASRLPRIDAAGLRFGPSASSLHTAQKIGGRRIALCRHRSRFQPHLLSAF